MANLAVGSSACFEVEKLLATVLIKVTRDEGPVGFWLQHRPAIILVGATLPGAHNQERSRLAIMIPNTRLGGDMNLAEYEFTATFDLGLCHTISNTDEDCEISENCLWCLTLDEDSSNEGSWRA